MAQRCHGQRLVYVADREGDCYDVLRIAHALDYPADLLIRARHNRSVNKGSKLWDTIEQQPVIGCISFTKPRKGSVKARRIIQKIKVLRYTLKAESAHPVTLTLVQARETDPPPVSHH